MSLQYTRTGKRAVRTILRIVRISNDKNIQFMAGSIAYSAFVLLLPLGVLLGLVASMLSGDPIVTHALSVTESYLTPAGESLVAETIGQASSQAGLSILGLLVLFWGTVRIFIALDFAFAVIYDTQRTGTRLSQIKDGIVVFAALSVALVVVLIAGFGLRFLPNLVFPRLLQELLLIGSLSIVFVPIYYVFPDVDLSLKMVLPGAVVAALGWTLLNTGFSMYIAYSLEQDLYGVLGGVMLLITFLYFGALLILIGATTNVVLARAVSVNRA